jgi:hypothetical protein
VTIRRRELLCVATALAAAACARPAPRVVTPPTAPGIDFDAWRQEAQGMLSDGLFALRTFESFHAFRASTAVDQGNGSSNELLWDAPTSAAWDEATHVAVGLHGRAEQLFLAVTGAQIDESLWRDQRRLADATHDLVDLGETLAAYRQRLDRLGVGNGSSAVGELDKLWAQWESAAARWSLSRAEPIGCSG